jgi:hypothetical protein
VITKRWDSVGDFGDSSTIILAQLEEKGDPEAHLKIGVKFEVHLGCLQLVRCVRVIAREP